MATIASTERTAAATRLATLGAIRVLGTIIAIVTAAIGVAYFVVSAIGPEVRWTDPVSGNGLFLALPLELRLVNAATFLLWCLTTSCLALIVADLAWRVRRGVEFVPAVSRAAWALAIVLAAGSWLAQLAENVSRQVGLVYPDDVDPATVALTDLPIDWGIGPFVFLPNPVFLGLAVVLAVLAYIIQAGERLQRETEGLV